MAFCRKKHQTEKLVINSSAVGSFTNGRLARSWYRLMFRSNCLHCMLTWYQVKPPSRDTNMSSWFFRLLPTVPLATIKPGADTRLRIGWAWLPGYRRMNSCDKWSEQFRLWKKKSMQVTKIYFKKEQCTASISNWTYLTNTIRSLQND